MCDDHDFDAMLAAAARSDELTRRRFAALSLGVSFTAMLPRVAGAAAVTESDVEVKTADGVCDAYFAHPSSGAAPAVVMWPDIMGLRPAFKAMGKRLAEEGYAVLVPNPFYRQQKGPALPPGGSFADKATREKLMAMADALTPEVQVKDGKAFIDYLDKQKSVDRKRKAGTAGYCMSGPITMRLAAALPDHIGAGASFHGARLATDQPDSPHLLVPKMKAHYLFAIAESDDQQDPKAKDLLREAFSKANLPAEIEVYQGTKHGWCPPDSNVYNEAQAEKAWAKMLALFKSSLI